MKPGHSLPRILTFAAGLAASLTALLAANFGLGEKTDFLLYRLWHLSRTSTFAIGLLLILVSFLPKLEDLFEISKAVHHDLRASVSKEERAATSARWSLFLLRLPQQFTLALVVAALAFWLNRRNLLGYIDGQYLLTLAKNQSDFANWNLGFSTNPLQGLGELWYFSNTRSIPELWVAHLTSDAGWQKIAVFCTAFAEIFLVVSCFSYWLGISSERAIASGWLAVLTITPLTYPPLIYSITADGPQIAFLITLPLIIVALLFGVGRGAHWLDAIRIAAIGFLLWLYFVAFGLFAALAYPLLTIVWTIFWLTSWPNRNEFWRRVAWSSLLLSALILSGLPQILLGIVKESAFYSFRELSPPDHDLSEGSILLRTTEPIGLAIAWLGFIGAIYHAIFGRGRIRWLGVAIAVSGGMILFASLLHAFMGLFGAKPIYYEYSLWPVYPIFAASLLGAIWAVAWQRLTKTLGRFDVHFSRLLWFILPLSGLIIFHGTNYLRGIHNDRPNVYPPTATALTEYLRSEIGLSPGAPFKGRVITLTGQSLPPKATWDQMFELDMGLIRSVGNDHRTIGLWYYAIPTLIEFSHTLSAIFYALVQSQLINDGDIQVRNLLNMRRENIHVLQLLGVRYVITDRRAPAAGTRRVRELSLPSLNTLLAVDEIPNANLGVSPTEIISLPSNEQALAWVGDEESDFNHIVLLDESNPGPLVAASNININIERGGIHVRANSTGRSLVVIPFQFSHCLQAISRGNRQLPELRRADFILTGLLFNENLDVTIRYRQGPFEGRQCRLNDFTDYLQGGAIR